MKKIIALLTAMAFALTLGVAFAEEHAPASAPTGTQEKAPTKAEAKSAKKKAAKKKAAAKKAAKKKAAKMEETMKDEAAPAPAAK